MSTAAVPLRYLRIKVLRPVELEMIGRNRPGNFSIQRSCDSSRSHDSYHMSVTQLRQCGSGPVDTVTRRTPYSIKTPRDRSVLGTSLEQYACGLDISFPAKRLQAFSKALVEIVRTNPPYARDVREIIYSPDGTTVKRWDRERGADSAPVAAWPTDPTEGDRSHLWHTHISQYRGEAEEPKTTPELVIRALHKGGLITEQRMTEFLTELGVQEPEDDMSKEDVLLVQRVANLLGTQPPLVEDGDFGPLTRAAVAGEPALVEGQKAAIQTQLDKANATLGELKTGNQEIAAESLALANKAQGGTP